MSEPKPKRGPEETLRILQEQAAEDRVFEDADQEISRMSEAELDAELRASGVDPDQWVKSFPMPAHLQQADAGAVPKGPRGASKGQAHDDPADGVAWVSAPPPAPPRTMPRRWAMLLAATLGAVAVAGFPIVMQLAKRHPPQPDLNADAAPTESAKPSPTGSAKPSAKQMRDAALAACAAHQWRACLDGLNAASELDPEGETDTRILDARQEATQALFDEDLRRRGIDPSKVKGEKPRRP